LMSGIEAVAKIIKEDKEVKSLFLSAYTDEEIVYRIVKIGGLGLLNKTIIDEELFTAIEKVYRREEYFGPDWTPSKIEELLKEYENFESVMLNFREEQILKLLSNELSSKEIAEQINLSKKTVDYYRRTISTKLGAKTQHELITFGIEYFKLKIVSTSTKGKK
jgi:DNA-binding NarL/FixJ family response regulator